MGNDLGDQYQMSHFHSPHYLNHKSQNSYHHYHQQSNTRSQSPYQKVSQPLIRQHHLVGDNGGNNEENLTNIYDSSSTMASTSNLTQRKLPVVRNSFDNNNSVVTSSVRPNTSPKIGNYTYFQPPRATYILGPVGSCAPVLQQNKMESVIPPSPSPRSPAELHMYSDRIGTIKVLILYSYSCILFILFRLFTSSKLSKS